jgi:pimeloyl-ACP methyl ester carboxylesterase
MLRWLKRIGAGIVGLIVVVLIVGAIYEQIMRSRASSQFPAPGRLVAMDGSRRMQIDCRGTGSPIVVFESGLDTMGSLSWSAVHDAVASTTRACAYSRPGVMWSDPRTQKFVPDGEARDLHALLAAAGEHAPYVLVGHSLGGPYIMNFTRLFPQDVAGLVFVDASHADQLARLEEAVGKKMEGGEGMMKVANALSWTGITRILASQDDDSSNFPAQAKAANNAYISRSIGAALEEYEALPTTLTAAGQLRQLGDRPLVVLTATKPLPEAVLKAVKMTPEQGQRMQAAWKALHDDEASWSHHSRHELVPEATHYIQFDKPDIVIAAVKEVVGDVRAGAGPAPSDSAAPSSSGASPSTSK